METNIFEETLTAHGWTLSIDNATVAPDPSFGDRPQLKYRCTLARHGRTVLETPFTMGIGHLPVRNARTALCATPEEAALLRAWQKKPGACFTDWPLWCRVAEKIRAALGTEPSLADVFASLLLDGAAFFDGETFEDWAANCGYDEDSRKAYAIYETCDRTGRLLARACTPEELAQYRDLAADY